MLDIYYKTTKSDNFKKIKSIRDGVWINVENAQKEDLEEIVKLTDLDYADLQDSLDPYELPRIERHEGSVIIFMRNPQDKTNKDEFLYTQLLTIVISNKYFITISISKNKVVESILDKGINFATTQRARLLIYILLQIAQKFTKEIKFVKNKVLSQKKHIKNIESSDIVNLIENEEILNQYTSSLSPMKSVFKTISKGKYIYLYEYDEDSLQDMIISMNQSVDLCDVSIKSIQSLRDSYQIIFTNRLNKVMKFLTSFTIIMTIPTIVASIYGMNVGLPLSRNPFAFWYIMIITVGISLIFTYIFFRKKWL
jgi:magnesium transporter